jgi:hypothetical protein
LYLESASKELIPAHTIDPHTNPVDRITLRCLANSGDPLPDRPIFHYFLLLMAVALFRSNGIFNIDLLSAIVFCTSVHIILHISKSMMFDYVSSASAMEYPYYPHNGVQCRLHTTVYNPPIVINDVLNAYLCYNSAE